jgi:general secretion pathway protein B
MSFILDALRKSETDRQRQAMPGLVDVGHRPPAARRALWIPVLILVLAANLVLMAVFWWRSPTASEEPGVAAAPTAMPPVNGPLLRRPADPGNTLAAVAGISRASDPVENLRGTQPDDDASASFTEIFEPPAETADVGTPIAAAAVSSESSGHIRAAELPTANELMATGTLDLPALHLDIHVFSATPAERFAFINMQKYTEGAALPEGPHVEQITADGVILSHQGQRFVLTRE